MATKSLKITIMVPHGVKSSDALVKQAAKAAQEVIDASSDLLALQQDLAAKGLEFTLDELASRRTKSTAATTRKATRSAVTNRSKKKAKRKKLTAADREGIIEDLKAGATANATAAKFGCSPASVNNIKRDAGLTKSRTEAV